MQITKEQETIIVELAAVSLLESGLVTDLEKTKKVLEEKLLPIYKNIVNNETLSITEKHSVLFSHLATKALENKNLT